MNTPVTLSTLVARRQAYPYMVVDSNDPLRAILDNEQAIIRELAAIAAKPDHLNDERGGCRDA